MENRRYPEQGFRSCLSIIRLAKRYSPERLDAACARAILLKAYSYKNVESILINNLDKQKLATTPEAENPIIHYNLRGREYYQQKEIVNT